jgi:phosphocarrier protein
MSSPAKSERAVKGARTVEICNARGLHARASAKFVKLASAFDAEVSVSRDGQTVDARSIMGLMMLAAGPGSTIEIAADGPEAEPAVEALAELVQSRFDEDQ